MKKTSKILSIILAIAMLLSMAPLSLTASAASANDKLYFASRAIYLKCNAAVLEAGSKSGYTKIKVDGEYVDFSKCVYNDNFMYPLGNSNYEADLSKIAICGALYGSTTGNINITMNGGVVDTLQGGCADPGTLFTGNVNITVNGGKVGEIIAARHAVKGNVTVTITGGTVSSLRFAYSNDSVIEGDCRLTATGGSIGLLNWEYDYRASINGSTNLYTTFRINGYESGYATNYVYIDGSTWKFAGDTVTALNGNTLTIASNQNATVDSGKTLSGTIVNNGTINVKNGGTLSGTVTNKGTVWNYGNVSGVTNSGSGKTIKKVTASGTNVTFNDSAWQNNATNYDDAYTATLTAASGYVLPDTVTVKVGGNTLDSSNYTYYKSTGSLSIPTAKINTDTTVSAV
ncbi:MAG: hypothetical protein IKU08_10555, partial [Clostridia bacterium]|nr:hypothetical protein [Clostridia bacterium]